MIRHLWTQAHLTEADMLALESMPLRIRAVPENRDVVREGETPTDICFVVSGIACRYKMVTGGRRQILSLHFPGEMPDLQSLFLDVMDHSIGTLAPSRFAFIPHDVARALVRTNPRVGEILLRHALIDASIFREWIVNVGRRTGFERVAHLFCEVFVRMQAIGMVQADTFSLPLTQAELGDATGLSTVHINRTIQQLRRQGLISTDRGVHAITDWEGLVRAADFDPTYLHLRDLGPA